MAKKKKKKTKKKSLKEIVRDIKSLKIQGASRVRKAALDALKESVRESRKKTLKEFRKELRRNMFLLLQSRPTEPGMRTALRFVLRKSEEKLSLSELKVSLIKACTEYEKIREQALERLAEIGSRMIPKKSVVLTHCHSHTVESILIKAWKKKLLQEVYCTESRPLYQGRITAKNLTKKGIPVTMIVDSAVSSFIPLADIDLFISGADAILADGSVVNKIGTLNNALAAQKNNIPYFAATGSIKFDPVTVFGVQEKIEERNWREVWAKKPKKLRIRNPAFDITPSALVTEIITEKGSFSPEAFAMIVYEELDLAHKSEKELSLHYLLKK